MIKIGCTTNYNNRMNVYHTGTPPSEQYDIQYYLLVEVNARDTKELTTYERKFTIHTFPLKQYWISLKRND